MKICYIQRRFSEASATLIDKANEIIAEYEAQGFSLTLRQCYYQFVARSIIPNNERSYKNLGSLMNDARLAGLIDWKCPCDLPSRYEEWIVAHQDLIVDFLAKRAVRMKQQAHEAAKAVEAVAGH